MRLLLATVFVALAIPASAQAMPDSAEYQLFDAALSISLATPDRVQDIEGDETRCTRRGRYWRCPVVLRTRKGVLVDTVWVLVGRHSWGFDGKPMIFFG